jgi:hypothetical protein
LFFGAAGEGAVLFCPNRAVGTRAEKARNERRERGVMMKKASVRRARKWTYRIKSIDKCSQENLHGKLFEA